MNIHFDKRQIYGRLLTRTIAIAFCVFVVAVGVARYWQRRLEMEPESLLLVTRNWPVVVVGLIAGVVLVGVLVWMVIVVLWIRPVEQLVDASQVMRWRGYLTETERQTLLQIGKDRSRIGMLARSLLTMEEENNHRFETLQVLLDTTEIVASSFNVNTAMNKLLAQMQQLFHVERCAVLLLNERTETFQMVASLGMGNYAERYNQRPYTDNLPSIRAIKSGKPVQIVDTENDLSFTQHRQRARSGRFRSVLAIPLQTMVAEPAVIILYKSEPYHYSYRELELASNFAHHAAVALDNTALYERTDERLQEQTRRLSAIVESMRDGLLLESLDGEILYCNPQLTQLAGERNLMGEFAPLRDGETADVTVDEQDWRVHRFDVTDARGETVGRGQLWQDITHDKQVDRMKSSLISTVSHELRTPLATIKGYASTLLAEDVAWDEVAQREFLQTISDETDRLTRLVKNLLDMSRIESGTLVIVPELQDVNRIVRDVVRRFPAETQQRVNVQLAADLPPVMLDAPRISTVIRNLLDNAVKYIPDNTPIDLYTVSQEHCIQITVRDYGQGIKTGLETQIFEQFFRADSSYTRQTGGVGVGLAICRGFVEAHGGTIAVENGRPGARFTVTLPLSI